MSGNNAIISLLLIVILATIFFNAIFLAEWFLSFFPPLFSSCRSSATLPCGRRSCKPKSDKPAYGRLSSGKYLSVKASPSGPLSSGPTSGNLSPCKPARRSRCKTSTRTKGRVVRIAKNSQTQYAIGRIDENVCYRSVEGCMQTKGSDDWRWIKTGEYNKGKMP